MNIMFKKQPNKTQINYKLKRNNFPLLFDILIRKIRSNNELGK